MNLNDTEKEIIYLLSIKQLIDEMVNYEVIELVGNDPNREVHFPSQTHKKYFNIMLVDFLSDSDPKITGKKQPYLKSLLNICDNPQFNHDHSVGDLQRATNDFVNWLNGEFTKEKIWLPSIDLEIDLSIKRKEFIKICGNISKHNFTRLSGVVNQLIIVFKRNNKTLTKEESLSILDEFYEWFHVDIFAYHVSSIAEFLNNIRWGIHGYLLPEYYQSIVKVEDSSFFNKYEYTYPDDVHNVFVKECYWNLMNGIRREPFMDRFEVNEIFKKRY